MPRLSHAYKTLRLDAVKSSFAAAKVPIYTTEELSAFIDEHRLDWNLRKSWTLHFILRLLIQIGCVSEIPLVSDHYPKKVRFAGRSASEFQLGLSLKEGAYISHGSAAFLHSLLDSEWNNSTIYINKEQSPKGRGGIPTQDTI